MRRKQNNNEEEKKNNNNMIKKQSSILSQINTGSDYNITQDLTLDQFQYNAIPSLLDRRFRILTTSKTLRQLKNCIIQPILINGGKKDNMSKSFVQSLCCKIIRKDITVYGYMEGSAYEQIFKDYLQNIGQNDKAYKSLEVLTRMYSSSSMSMKQKYNDDDDDEEDMKNNDDLFSYSKNDYQRLESDIPQSFIEKIFDKTIISY